MARVRATGGSIFKRLVEPYLKRAARTGGNFRGVLDKQIYSVPNVKVIRRFRYTKRSRREARRLRRQFNCRERKNFLQGLDVADLRAHGFTQPEINLIQKGKVPDGYEVHHKAPLDDSGTNARSNLILIRNSPEHQLITNHQRWATEGLAPGQSRVISWPLFPSKTWVWPPHKSITTTILP